MRFVDNNDWTRRFDELDWLASREFVAFFVDDVASLFVFGSGKVLTERVNVDDEDLKRVADGEYDLDVRGIVRTRFPDEMFELADSFALMAKKVGARERSLTQEVQRLKVEIDQSRREEAVSQITDNDDFAALAVKAQEMRKRMREGLGKE